MDAAKLTKYIQRLTFFKGIPDDVAAMLAEKVEFRTLAKGDILVRQGDASNALFIIQTGWVKIVKGTDGEEVVLNQCGPGQVVGEMSLIDQTLRSATIVALSPTTVLELKRDVVMAALHQYPVLALTFARSMAERLRFANTYVEKAIEWSQHISRGEYSSVLEQVKFVQSTIVDAHFSYEARAGAFLSAFFKMVEGVKEREENLKRQLHQLTIQVDEAKREESVKELTDNTFFDNLQAAAMKFRQERLTKDSGSSEQANKKE